MEKTDGNRGNGMPRTRFGLCGLWIQMAGLPIARVYLNIIMKLAIQTRKEGE